MGYLVDASASMEQSKNAQAGLEAFTNTLKYSVAQIKQVDKTAVVENNIDFFAFGFGFDNPFSLLSGMKSWSIKNLFGRNIKQPIISFRELDHNWENYNHSIQNLAIKANGTSPMLAGLKQVEKTFNTLRTDAYGLKILVILSDGLVSDAPDYEILKQISKLKKQNTVIITLYLSDKSVIKSKIVHNRINTTWDEGAKLMAECASSIGTHTYLSSYLKEHGWTVYPDGKLMIQISAARQNKKQHTIKVPRRKNIKTQHDIVFISHHHHDKQCAEQIQQHLSPFKRRMLIKIWDDKHIETEKNWRDDIDELLLSARAVVLVISPDYLATDFISKETLSPLLKRAAHNGTEIIPLILGSSRFQFVKSLSCYPPINSAYQPLSALPEAEKKKVMKQLIARIEATL